MTRSFALDAAVGDDPQVLPSNAEHGALPRGLSERAGQGDLAAGEQGPLASDRDRDGVHRGAADEAGHEQVRRSVVDLLGRRPPVGAHRRRAPRPDRPWSWPRPGRGSRTPRWSPASAGARPARPGSGAQLGVQVRQRFVHEEATGRRTMARASATPLALASRQLAGLSTEELAEPELPAASSASAPAPPWAPCGGGGELDVGVNGLCGGTGRGSGTPWRRRGRGARSR